MTHPVHTVMRHVVEICEVLAHWRRERWTPSERGKEIGGRRGEESRQRRRQRKGRERRRKR